MTDDMLAAWIREGRGREARESASESLGETPRDAQEMPSSARKVSWGGTLAAAEEWAWRSRDPKRRPVDFSVVGGGE